MEEQFGTFDHYIWQTVGGQPRLNSWRSLKQVPARSAESDAMRKDLRRRGFNFVGSTLCYAFMQPWLVNDHLVSCFRWKTDADDGEGERSPKAPRQCTRDSSEPGGGSSE